MDVSTIRRARAKIRAKKVLSKFITLTLMCRLLGVIANKPVDLEFSLTRFRRFGEENPDG